MKLNELKPQPGSQHRRKRVGRGPGSGQGKTSGRGHKGAGARSGGKVHSGFEGGQMPLIRRVPKRGFRSRKEKYALINVKHLNRFLSGENISPEGLKEMGLVKKSKNLIKILGQGELARKGLEVTAHAFTQGAIRKIETAGGKTEVIKHA